MKPMSAFYGQRRIIGTGQYFVSGSSSVLLLGFSSPLMSWAALPGEEDWEAPLGLDGDFIVIPKDNPLTKEKVELESCCSSTNVFPKITPSPVGVATCPA